MPPRERWVWNSFFGLHALAGLTLCIIGAVLIVFAVVFYPGGSAFARQGNSDVRTDAARKASVVTTSVSPCTMTVIPNDGGTSGNARAPNTNWRWGRAVYLITASELAASGYPPGASSTTIGWNYQTGGVADSIPLTIYMQNTTDTTNTKDVAWVNAIVGMTTVHNALTPLPSVAGPFDITLTGGSSFTYTGDGLYIAFEWGEYTGVLSTGAAAWCNHTSIPFGLLGAQSSNGPQPNLVASNFRPETRLNSFIQNDAAVTAVYSLGELPLGFAGPQTIQAIVTNNGTNTLTDLPVTLNVTGADLYGDTEIIPSLAGCGGQAVVTFAPLTPGVLGNDTVQVSIPADDVAANNSLSKPLSITSFGYSYKLPDSTPNGGAGINGGTTGALIGKFSTSTSTAVTDVRLEFFAASGTAYRVAIYGDSGSGTPSTTPLFVDAADRSVENAGPVTITLPAPVAVGPGNFYVGIQQTNTTNASLSYDNETPVRSGAFYLAINNPPAAWFDFSPGTNFKLNIGVTLQDPNATPAPTATPTPTAAPTPSPTPTPPNTVSISGTVDYCSNPSLAGVPGVTMNLSGTTIGSTITTASGSYTFSALPTGGTYTVTPTKSALAPAAGGINTVDVIAVQRHFLGIALLSGCRLSAGDVNGDSTISTVDVIAVQRFFLGFTTGIGNAGKYQFTPASRTHSGIVSDQLGQNFDVLIFGDVAGPFAD